MGEARHVLRGIQDPQEKPGPPLQSLKNLYSMWYLLHQLGAAPFRQTGYHFLIRKSFLTQLTRGFHLERKEQHPSYYLHLGRQHDLSGPLDPLVFLYSGPNSFGGRGLLPLKNRGGIPIYSWVELRGNIKLQISMARGREGVSVGDPIPQSCSPVVRASL